MISPDIASLELLLSDSGQGYISYQEILIFYRASLSNPLPLQAKFPPKPRKIWKISPKRGQIYTHELKAFTQQSSSSTFCPLVGPAMSFMFGQRRRQFLWLSRPFKRRPTWQLRWNLELGSTRQFDEACFVADFVGHHGPRDTETRRRPPIMASAQGSNGSILLGGILAI